MNDIIKSMGTNQIIILVFAVLLLSVVVVRFYEYRVTESFVVFSTLNCEPEQESCFVAECSDDTSGECDTSPYKKIRLSSKEAPACIWDQTCEQSICTDFENCELILCSEDSLELGEICTK